MSKKDFSKSDRHFLDVCRYLSYTAARVREPLLAEAHELLTRVGTPLAGLRGAMLSKDPALLQAVHARFGAELETQTDLMLADGFWTGFDGAELESEIVAQAFSIFFPDQIEPAQFKARFPRLARRAILQDMPALLTGLLNLGTYTTDNVHELLFSSANILNARAECAPIIFDLVLAHPLDAASWQVFYDRSMAKEHWKSACFALAMCPTIRAGDAAGDDIESGKARRRIRHKVSSAHGVLSLFSLLPEPQKILSMKSESFGQFLDAKLAPLPSAT